MAGGVATCCNWSCPACAKSMEDDATTAKTATDQSATRGCVRRGRREEMIADLKVAVDQYKAEVADLKAKLNELNDDREHLKAQFEELQATVHKLKEELGRNEKG